MEIRSIEEAQKYLVEKQISCVELIDHYLGEIDKKNKILNAFLTVTSEEAYLLAKKYDSLIKNSPSETIKKYPLLGVVVSYKDLFSTKNIRTTAASKVLDSYIPVYSATVVERIEAAGGIIIGKTNCDAWAHGASGENSDFGPTLNPHNTEYVPGGSSSGSAVSVASGMSLISFGTDTGGSVRQPANFCGVVGLKPTYGSVSRYGVLAMASSLDCVGHFSTNARDIRKVFNITKGHDNKDATIKKGSTNLKKQLVIGIPEEYFGDGVDSVVSENVQSAINILKKAGFVFKSVKLPTTKQAISVYYIIQPAEVSSNLGRFDGIRFGNDRKSFGTEAKRRIMLGTFVLSSGYFDAYYKKATQVRTLIISEFDKVFENVDLLIAPVSPTPPFKIGDKVNDPLKMYLSDVLTVPANIAGIPALSVPFGKYSGLPLGFQLMGPRFSEELLFSVASKFESLTDYKFNTVFNS